MPADAPLRETAAKRPRRQWKPEFDDALRADWWNGVSKEEFARRLGVYTSTVTTAAKRLGLEQEARRRLLEKGGVNAE
jgi:DNA-binding transcriptional regulator YiaG